MKKRKKLLWASPTNLLDTSSGFSLSVREMLAQLFKNDYEVQILSAAIFDSKVGMSIVQKHKDFLSTNLGKFIDIEDDNLVHKTFITKSIVRDEMTSYEESVWFSAYLQILDSFNPDIVFFYRNGLLELSIAREAKIRNISTVVNLVNSSYSGKTWLRDVDLIITDSLATSKMYKDRENYDLVCIGDFLSKNRYIATKHTRKNLLFVNPILQKGVIFIIQLALYLEEIGSDIIIEVVNSRGNWQDILKHTTAFLGKERESLSNVYVTENTTDMKGVYSRARLLLVPSFGFESAGRVIAEAQLNGIPVIGSSSGGIPEMIGDGGFVINFPKEFHIEPYTKLANLTIIENVISIIVKLYTDEQYYNSYSQKALSYASIHHNIETNTKRLINSFNKLIE